MKNKNYSIKNLLWALFVFPLLLQFGAVQSQTLTFLYFGPSAGMVTAFGAGNVQAMSYGSTALLSGYRFVTISAANAATFRSIAPSTLVRTYDSLTINSELKRRVDRVLQLSGGVVDVQIWMVDDRTGLTGEDPYVTTKLATNDRRYYVWPSARNYANSAVSGRYIGEIYIGEHFSPVWAPHKKWESLILHEFSHTQKLPDTRGPNKWGHNGVDISYGGDAGHFLEELQADEQQPLDEAMGTFWGLLHYMPDTSTIIGFMNRTDRRFWLGSRSFLSGVRDMWSAPGTERRVPARRDVIRSNFGFELNTQLTSYTGDFIVKNFRWVDVPGKYVLYNENMSLGFLYLFWRFAFSDHDRAFNCIYDAAGPIMRSRNHQHFYPGSLAYAYARTMEAYAATPQGQQEATNRTLVSSMFAFAMIDLVCHFGESDADFRRRLEVASYQFGSNHALAHTNYFAHRQAIKNIANGHITNSSIDIIAAAREIRDYFREPSRILRP